MTGICAQYVGWSEAEMELADGARLSDVLAALAEQAGEHGHMFFDAQTGYPSLEVLTVVNGAASPGRTVLQDGDVVTLIPPAAGGCLAPQARPAFGARHTYGGRLGAPHIVSWGVRPWTG